MNETALFEVANAKTVTDLIEEEGIECELRDRISGWAFLDQEQAEQLKRQYDELRSLSPNHQDITCHGPGEAEELTSVPGAKAAFTFLAATLWYVFLCFTSRKRMWLIGNQAV